MQELQRQRQGTQQDTSSRLSLVFDGNGESERETGRDGICETFESQLAERRGGLGARRSARADAVREDQWIR